MTQGSSGSSVPSIPWRSWAAYCLSFSSDALVLLSHLTVEGSQAERLPQWSRGIRICSSPLLLLILDVQKDVSGVQQTRRDLSCSVKHLADLNMQYKFLLAKQVFWYQEPGVLFAFFALGSSLELDDQGFNSLGHFHCHDPLKESISA